MNKSAHKIPDKKIVMLLSNPFDPDVRVLKEAQSLVNNGFSVTVIAWDREKKYPKFENVNGIFVERCQLKSTYGKGLGSLLEFLFFHIYLVLKLIRREINIIHCHDLDTLPAGFCLSKIKRCKIVYDAHELEYFVTFPEFLRKMSKKSERFFSKRVNNIFVVNEIQRKKFYNFIEDRDKITLIRNCPVSDFFVKVRDGDKKNATVVMGYVGYIQNGIGLETALGIFDTLCEKFHHLELLLVGKIHPNFKTIFEGLIANSRNKEKIKIIGPVPYNEVIKYYQRMDISFILYENNHPQYRYNSPTKFYEAMALGIPVVVTQIGDVQEIIEACRCGVVVDAEDRKKILETFGTLIEDANIRNQMGQRGHLYAKENFRWEIMETRLLEVYSRIK